MTAPTDVIDRLTRALADRYTIERELGAGGMATVYLASDLKHERQVALKVLRPELAAILGAERFLNEIKVTANLQHPNILPLYDSGEADTFLYYVMPYIEGETLRDKLAREKQLGVDDTVEIARAVAAALQFAHTRGVVHRDIKPENILLQSGQALVADFGIALAVSQAGGTRLTETGLSLGTPHYMSPEQATGDRTLDARSDVYSLAAMVYEMLVGEPPHLGNSVQAIVAKILSERPSPITQARDLVPLNVDAAVQKALSKSPADRFATAADFAAALTNPAFTLTHMTGVIGAAAGRGQRRLVTALGAGAVVLAGLAAWGWLRPAGNDATVSRQWIGLDARRPDGSLPAGALMAQVALAPDGSAIVWADSAEGQLWIKERASADALPLTGAAATGAVFFAPDGRWIGFVGQNGVFKVARSGGAAVKLSDSTGGGAFGTWLDDGSVLFTSSDYSLLYRTDAQGGPLRRVLASNRIQMAIGPLTPLPGGRGVLISGCPGLPCIQGTLWALDLAADTIVAVAQGASMGRYISSGHVLYGRADGGLFAVPFDLGRLATTGAPIPVLNGVRTVAGLPEFVLASDGTLLYVAGAAGTVANASELVWVDRSGAVTLVDSTLPVEQVGNAGLSLSPDGTQMAITLSDGRTPLPHIFVKRLPVGPPARLTFDGSLNVRPTWSPDGRDLVYASDRGGQPAIWRKRADGSSPETLIASETRPIWEGVLSPDGQWLVYRTDDVAAGRGDILARRLTGDTTPIALAATPFEETSPALSPDGRWLAYSSNEGGRKEVFVRPFPNVGDGRWQVSGDGGTEPLWSADGRELFYRAQATRRMMAAQVQTTPTFRVTDQRALFSDAGYFGNDDHRYYAVSRDGRRFLMVRGRPAAISPGRMMLVQRWFTELQAQLGR